MALGLKRVLPAHRVARRLVGPLVALACTAGLSGCASQARADDFVRQSCQHVIAGIDDYDAESPGASAVQIAALDNQALSEFALAEPLAAHASENSLQWAGLMTDLQETNRVPIKYLIPALKAQCAGALGSPVAVPSSNAN